jgi:hypothetical protein
MSTKLHQLPSTIPTTNMTAALPADVLNLPDELLLYIIHYFESIRSFEPQSTAFQDKKKECARQCENRIRQLTLHSLCLTSRRLRDIATPTLYASFHESVTLEGLERLKLFHRTISGTGPSLGQKRLSDHLQYIETRLADHLGNSLSEDIEHFDAYNLPEDFFDPLGDIVRLAPNVQHLSVVSVETHYASFWKHILPERPPALGLPGHGFKKLRTLCFQMHTEGRRNLGPVSFDYICSAMMSLPLLVDFQASGAVTEDYFFGMKGSSKQLQRLEITQCELNLGQMWSLLFACKGLRHVVCEWAFDIPADGVAPWVLLEGLLLHAETLQTLHVDMREIMFYSSSTPISNLLGDLRPFRKLESLTICETSLTGSGYILIEFPRRRTEHRIKEFLPDNLKTLTFLLDSGLHPEGKECLDEILALWHLLEDCKKRPTDLRKIMIVASFQPYAPKLKEAFAETDIEFDVARRAIEGFGHSGPGLRI